MYRERDDMSGKFVGCGMTEGCIYKTYVLLCVPTTAGQQPKYIEHAEQICFYYSLDSNGRAAVAHRL